MNVTCPNCATTYRVDPAKVPEAGVRARCAVCSAVFAVNREGRPAATRAPEPVSAAAPRAAPLPRPRSPRRRATSRRRLPSRRCRRRRPCRSRPEPRPEPPRPEPKRVEPPPMPAPAASSPAASSAAARPPATPAPAAPVSPVPPRPAAPSRPVQPPPPPAATPSAPPPAAARPPAPAGSRPVNPFLSQDPSLKAKRLARALISDMVVYHPAKRQEGLRDGNLKELFDEEIKKSWEEYSDQVGRRAGGVDQLLPGSAERDPGRRPPDLLTTLGEVRSEMGGVPHLFCSSLRASQPLIFPGTSTGRTSMADLTERLTGLQHRVLELRDFL